MRLNKYRQRARQQMNQLQLDPSLLRCVQQKPLREMVFFLQSISVVFRIESIPSESEIFTAAPVAIRTLTIPCCPWKVAT